MSLPSQTARTSPAGRSFVYKGRRKRKGPPPIVYAVGGTAAVLLAVVGFALFGPGFGGPSSAEAAATDGVEEPAEPVAVSSSVAPSEPLPSAGRRDVLPSLAGGTAGAGGLEAAPAGRSDPEAEASGEGSLPTPPPMAPSRGMLAEAVNGAEPDGSGPVVTPPAGEGGAARAAPRTGRGGRIAMHLDAADQLMLENDPLAARQALWDAMRMPDLEGVEARVLRDRLTALNEAIVFTGPHRAGDPLTLAYTVRPGDALSRIAREQRLGTHWRLIQRVNGLASPNHIRAGQTLKLVRGPFHAVVDKSAFRLDLYHGPTERASEWVYVRSFEVGLGEGDSTPVGRFVVREDSKLENPGWVNPRNPAEKYAPDDPENPIGEFWIGLDGLGDTAVYAGYGIHGTIDPGSIGRERSMGCVRLGSEDIALLYELLGEGDSLVEIRR